MSVGFLNFQLAGVGCKCSLECVGLCLEIMGIQAYGGGYIGNSLLKEIAHLQGIRPAKRWCQ